ncbi:DHA2 family efflux MFS transporter permease subunit [Cryptosporangium phraense]|uniref:DHA2 family efflux MFS transporter permease subunit n=1 Tax=Cryptosporangium phraense TaxID=2593070 RepID=A0A545AM72_9ACTN|nr:DHA2 family efflux MFS transporter permease subunit [Cryptosporangium phraense]TQS42406.1 DHA2 family efflux MFS transporter permease subunit [Cryptosporangium phraense]
MRNRSALAILCGGQLLVVLDQTIVNVALPVIQDDLDFSPAGLAWVVNSYLVGFGGLLLLAGRLGDLIGRVRVLLAGTALFTLASLACGLATAPAPLIAARLVQGVGGALLSAVALGMIVALYPETKERATAIGFFSFVAAVGGALGPIVGGALTQGLSWHWIFFVNVPIGALIVVLAARVLPPERGTGLRSGADLPGAVLVTGGLMLAVYTIVGTTEHGWASVRTLGFGAVAVVLLVAFLARQATAPAPLLPLRLFRSRELSGANAVQVLMIGAMFGFLFLSTLLLQRVFGFGVSRTGFALLPAPVAIAVVTLLISPRLNTRFGEPRVLAAGLGLIFAGFLVLTQVPVDGPYATRMLPAVLLVAIGFGTAIPALTALAMAGARPEDAGLASGVFNTGQQVGGALGLAVLATLAASRTAGSTTPGALLAGYHVAFAVAAALIAVAATLTLTALLPTRRPLPII